MDSKAFIPATGPLADISDEGLICLELEDGSAYQGYSFGAKKSSLGELVFQTGMVGYPESLTDPSYRGQILIITFPLVGNYGVPSRDTLDDLLGDLPANFESSNIHISGLVASSYSGENYSHFLATSSLGAWLKEQGIPAMYGVDTRALTKHIREKGSMLGQMLMEKKRDFSLTIGVSHVNGETYRTSRSSVNGLANGFDHAPLNILGDSGIGSPLPRAVGGWKPFFDGSTKWIDPNNKNLVAEGMLCAEPLVSFVSNCCCQFPSSHQSFTSHMKALSRCTPPVAPFGFYVSM